MRNEVSIGRERRLSSCCQISVLSLLIVTLGIVHAVADGVADADGVGLEDLEGDGLAEGLSELFVEGLTGSTVSLPLWAYGLPEGNGANRNSRESKGCLR